MLISHPASPVEAAVPSCDQSSKPHRRHQLAARRRALGWTQVALAHHLGVTVYTVQRWEWGLRRPARRHCPALAAALGVSLLELAPLLGDHCDRQQLHATMAHLQAQLAELQAQIGMQP